MATALDLEQAAGQAFNNLFAKWVAGTLKTDVLAFVTTSLPDFPEQVPDNHPIANWLVLSGSSGTNMPPGNSLLFVPYEQLVTIANYIYRLCWMGNQLNVQTSITGAQAAALLAAYNANF